MIRYEVQTQMAYGWENCWTDGDGYAVTFGSFWEAADAVAEHINDQRDAVARGDMTDECRVEDFRIVVATEELV